ncbi:MAG: ATP-grasp domain-containing protein, partial [Nanoarchaeota archaeon]|nr:ATP-grasp domain-containing protein [Nanoarchaeota archaeon]
NAGVHSGDATMVLPPQRTYLETTRRIKNIAKAIAKSLKISGPFNIQFIAKENYVKVIECNLRASRSFPFCSKVFKLNFIEIATKAIMGKDTPKIDKSVFELDYVGVKAPQFSFTRLKGADPVLGVEMASTGEVACFGDDLNEAFLKAYVSAGWVIPEKKKVLLSTGPLKSKAEFLMSAKQLHDMGYTLYATEGTYAFLRSNDVKCTRLYWPLQNRKPNVIDYLSSRKIDLVINIPKSREETELTNDYLIRRTAVDFNITLITDIKVAKRFVTAISECKELTIKSWDEY